MASRMSRSSHKKSAPLKRAMQEDSENSTDASDDVPLARKQFKRSIKDDRGKRFDFLLQQTDIFSHFINSSGKKKTEETRGRKPKKSNKSSSSRNGNNETSAVGGGRRQRNSKRGEDDEILKGNVAQRSNEVHFDTTPHYIKNGEMRDYQLRGLNWMISLMDNGINGILADEMGLGKTLQTISMLGYLKHFRNSNGPHLVIVPKSTLQNWCNEIKRWCPSLKFVCLIGDKNARKEYISDVIEGTEWDVMVTSYQMCLMETQAIKRYDWQYLVIDEAHRIKNENSLLSEIVRKFRTAHRLLLTGTPLQNNLHELWSLLNFLLPDVFNSSEDFDTWFETNKCVDDKALVERLHAVLKPFLLRRLKSEVEASLLPKKEIKIYVGLSKMQREWYSKVLLKDIDIVTGCGKVEKMRLGMVLMHLRKVTNHPYLFEGAEEGPPYDRDLTHLVQNCGKMVILDRLLTRLKEEGSRVLIFSQMTRVLDILEDFCEWRGHLYHRLDGQTPHEDRAKMIDEYNAEDSPSFIFMLSTRAGGLGINLATADSVIIYDSDWNPQSDLQAIDRAHRIGQKKQVRVFRLVTENTIDEKIIERAEIKLRLDRMVIQKGLNVDQNPNKIDKAEMLNMIRFGANKILNKTGSDISEEDIDTILKKCEVRTQAELEKLEKLEAEGEASLRKFTFDTPSSVYNFEGEDWLKKQKKHNAEVFIELPKRARKFVNYSGLNQGDNNEATTSRTSNSNITAPVVTTHATGVVTNPPKPPTQYHDFQFLPEPIFELAEKEKFHHYKKVGYRIPITVYNQNNSNIARFNSRVDYAEPLTADELREKEELLQEGFGTWTKRQFDMYINALAEYGPDEIANVAASVEGKTLKEVETYNKVFHEKAESLKNYEHIMTLMAAGEEKREQKANQKRLLEAKIKSYRQPFLELKLSYPPMINSKYSQETDRFLICTLNRLGLHEPNVYASLRHAVQTTVNPKVGTQFMRSRTAMNLRERCEYLLSLIVREGTENNGEFVGTRHLPPPVITGPVVDLDSSEDEDECEEEEDAENTTGNDSDIVLIDDSDEDVSSADKNKAKILKQPTTTTNIIKKSSAPASNNDEDDESSSSSNRTEVEEVVPVESSDNEEFDLSEYLARHGYQNHGNHLKKIIKTPAESHSKAPVAKKRKLDSSRSFINPFAKVTEIIALESDDSSPDSESVKTSTAEKKMEVEESNAAVDKSKEEPINVKNFAPENLKISPEETEETNLKEDQETTQKSKEDITDNSPVVNTKASEKEKEDFKILENQLNGDCQQESPSSGETPISASVPQENDKHKLNQAIKNDKADDISDTESKQEEKIAEPVISDQIEEKTDLQATVKPLTDHVSDDEIKEAENTEKPSQNDDHQKASTNMNSETTDIINVEPKVIGNKSIEEF